MTYGLRVVVTFIIIMCSATALGDARVEARKHFQRGMAHFRDGRIDQGVEELLEAYAIKPHPNVLFNIAKAYDGANRAPEALTYYRRYVQTRPPDLEGARKAIDRLAPIVAATTAAAAADAGSPSPVENLGVNAEHLERIDSLVVRLEDAVRRAEENAELPKSPLAPSASEKGAAAAAVKDDVQQAEDFGVPYEETVVAASRRSQSTMEAPNAITVISGEEIRASGLTSLPEILRRVPGAEVMMMGSSSSNVSLRGFNQRINNKVLLLVDGRPEYQDFLGLTLWPSLPIQVEEIERIEVIRGPGSALYGANAMLGVINIITRTPGTGRPFEATAGVGLDSAANVSGVISGGGLVKYRGSAGFSQIEKYSRDFPADAVGVRSNFADPGLGLRSVRANMVAYLPLSRNISISASGGVNRLFTEVYAIGLLRNFFFDGLTGYAKSDLTFGPVKVRFFWNHTSATSGPQYQPATQRSLVTQLEANVFDMEALFQKEFQLAGTHVFGLGLSGRLKRVKWGYLGPLQQELHAAFFVQEEWKPLSWLSLVGSYRVDRHPLLDNGSPGFAQSPRVSVLVRPTDNHAFRASWATAFRQPTFLESYMDIRTPVTGMDSASVLTQGERALKPERLISFEIGYRGEAPSFGLSWEAAAYWNIVSDLVVLSAINPLPTGPQFDPVTNSLVVGRSTFLNDPTTYTARGLELSGGWTPVRGLDIRASTSMQFIVANEAVPVCGPCSQAPVVKANLGVTYRTPIRLDLSADASIVSDTSWVEREPDPTAPSMILNRTNPLGAYAVINGRISYTLFDGHLTLSLVGTQLGPQHQEHPFGNTIRQRVFFQVTAAP